MRPTRVLALLVLPLLTGATHAAGGPSAPAPAGGALRDAVRAQGW
jgi:hypothetical protein